LLFVGSMQDLCIFSAFIAAVMASGGCHAAVFAPLSWEARRRGARRERRHRAQRGTAGPAARVDVLPWICPRFMVKFWIDIYDVFVFRSVRDVCSFFFGRSYHSSLIASSASAKRFQE